MTSLTVELTVIAMVIGLISLSVALVLNLGSDPALGQPAGAAWAWVVGVSSILFLKS